MLDILREWWDMRAGRQQAEHEIKLIVSGYQTAADLFRQELPRIAKEGP
ncbi:MAG: hypothetical protein HC900_05330 [Methylacidiphilales bacterium]|nr:hypothetical protein [Candidatus Methylacidiphilales bacterium]